MDTLMQTMKSKPTSQNKTVSERRRSTTFCRGQQEIRVRLWFYIFYCV